MDTEKEVRSLAAETLALQAILTNVLSRLATADEKTAAAIRKGFDDAASQVENMAIELGKAASPDHTVKAIGVVEQLRAATLGNPDQPKHLV